MFKGVAGITYGVTGASLMLVTEEDSYTNRMIAGCSSGVSLGIFSNRSIQFSFSFYAFLDRSLPVACVGCVSLGALAAFSKLFNAKSLSEKSEFLQELNRPIARKDEKWE